MTVREAMARYGIAAAKVATQPVLLLAQPNTAGDITSAGGPSCRPG